MATWILRETELGMDFRVPSDSAEVSWPIRQPGASPKAGDTAFIWRPSNDGEGASAVIAECLVLTPSCPADDEGADLGCGDSSADARPNFKLRVLRTARHRHLVRVEWFTDDPVLRSIRLPEQPGGTLLLNQSEGTRLRQLWERTGIEWDWRDSVAGLWAYVKTKDKSVSKKPGSPVAIVALSTGRAVSGVYNKVMNFRHLDPTDVRKGMRGSGQTDERAWAKFFDDQSGCVDQARLASELRRMGLALEISVPSLNANTKEMEGMEKDSTSSLNRGRPQAENGQQKSKTYASLARLQQRAFGGQDVAARPNSDDDDWWPRGQLLRGVEELMEDALSCVDSAQGLTVYFLLGGAGNGKSFAIRALASRLEIPVAKDGNLASRLYSGLGSSVDINLLNDATIAPHENYPGRQDLALATDLHDWWLRSEIKPVVAFCGVNRGIVIDELRALGKFEGEIAAVPREILRWLANPGTDIAANVGADLAVAASKEFGPDCQYIEMTLAGRPIRLAALAVDSTSLFDPSDQLRPSRATSVMKHVVEKCLDDAARRPQLCPIRANVEQLSDSSGIDRWAEAISAAEVAGGRLYSYRDVWGLIALSILGCRSASDTGDGSTLAFIDSRLQDAERAQTPWDVLRPLLELSRFRMHNALYRAPLPVGKEARPWYPPSTPVHGGLALIDPSAWPTNDSPVIETAMQSIAMGELPSETTVCAPLLEAVWSHFDRALEAALVAFVRSDECSDLARRRLISWLGGYMMRLASTGTGNIGNLNAVEAWKSCLDRARKGNEAPPLELKEAIRTLLFPTQEGGPAQSVALPAFSSRAEPIQMQAQGREPMLGRVFEHRQIGLRLARAGIRPVIECVMTGHGHQVVGQLTLDFSLIREALSCRGGRTGQTESTAFVEARLERCRGSSLDALPESQETLVAFLGPTYVELRK